MRVGLFIPCSMDAFEPEVDVAAVRAVLGMAESGSVPYTHPAFRTARYAVFHTGPSATADIEGVLIHGAQGVRSLTVIVDG
jgi:hypothetical protein